MSGACASCGSLDVPAALTLPWPEERRAAAEAAFELLDLVFPRPIVLAAVWNHRDPPAAVARCRRRVEREAVTAADSTTTGFCLCGLTVCRSGSLAGRSCCHHCPISHSDGCQRRLNRRQRQLAMVSSPIRATSPPAYQRVYSEEASGRAGVSAGATPFSLEPDQEPLSRGETGPADSPPLQPVAPDEAAESESHSSWALP